MDVLEIYANVLMALSVALLLIAAGLSKKQIVWRPRRLRPVRSRRRGP